MRGPLLEGQPPAPHGRRVLASITDFAIVGVGVLLAFWSTRHRCLHDLVFGSEVVLERPGAIGPAVLWSGLIGFEEERQAARDEKTKSLKLVKGFVKFLITIGSPLTWLLAS